MQLRQIAIALSIAAAGSAGAQTPITVSLTPTAPSPGNSLRWSPYGATVQLSSADGKTLTGKFPLGPDGSPLIQVKLANVGDSAHFNTLWVDANRDGRLTDDEKFTTTPKIQNFKWWSSFGPVTVSVPVPAEDGKPATTRPYTLNLWYVFDPAEENPKPTLRWSRSGWHTGEVEVGGKPAYVIITEWEQDGKFDQRDAWAIARDPRKALTADSRKMETHAWLDSVAYRPISIDPSGRWITFDVVHPNTTEAEEIAKKDIYAPDSLAPKAPKPVAFSKDLSAVLAEAAHANKRTLVAFDAVWCGPCHVMDRLVYTSVAVVDASKNLVAAKIDGDERPDLKKRFNVGAFPTVILLDSTGKEIRRAVGYQSVADMVAFLK